MKPNATSIRTMQRYQALALRQLLAQRVTSLLILLAVLLSTAMTAAIGQSIGVLGALRRQQAASLNGDRYATLHQLSAQQADAIEADSRLAYTGRMLALGNAELPGGKLSVLLREYYGNAASAYANLGALQSGRLPQAPGEIALPADVLALLGFDGQIGDPIVLELQISLLRDTELPYKYTAAFTLTGILQPNYVGYVNGVSVGMVGIGTGQRLLPERYLVYSLDLRTAPGQRFQAVIDSLAEEYRILEHCIQYNAILLNAVGIPYRSAKENTAGEDGFSYMALTGVVIAALVLLAAGLVIYNVLKIAVTKRVRQFGVLRAIGAQRGQLYTLVALELAALCGLGIPLGAGLGLLFSSAVTQAAAAFFSGAKLFAASSPEALQALLAQNASVKPAPLALSAGITLLFAFAAALPAVRYAGSVSPVAAMAGQSVPIKRRRRKTGRIRSFEAFYARMNLSRSRGRTAITVLSLVMSIAVYVALQSFVGLLDASANVRKMHLGDYALTSKAVGFTPQQAQELAAEPWVERLSTLKYRLYEQNSSGGIEGIDLSFLPCPGETVQLVAVDEARLRALAAGLDEAEKNALLDGNACLIKNPIAIAYGDAEAVNTALEQSQTITVNGRALRVAALLDNPVTLANESFLNGVQILVTDAVFDELSGGEAYTELYPALAARADRADAEQVIERLCRTVGGSWLSYENTDRQLAESYRQIELLAWGLILFIGLIGVLNIINTVYTNIHTRLPEIGMQRAIGMSAAGLYKTFLWEGAYYGAAAAGLGGLVGYLCTVLAGAAATGTLQWTAVPWVPILQASALAITACLLATCIPLRKIARLGIVDTIEMPD